jgi:hypothetical protein
LTGELSASEVANGLGRNVSMGCFLVRAYLYLGLLGCAVWSASIVTTGVLLLLVVALSVPATLALWHRATVRALLSLVQFQEGRGLHWLASRLVLAKVLGVAVALVVCASAVVHASLIGIQEWLFLGSVPLLYATVCWVLQGWVSRQFRGAAFRSRGLLVSSGWVVFLIILGGWVCLAVFSSHAQTDGILERVAATQEPWKSAPSALGNVCRTHSAASIEWN